jgi:hypothetical protein
LKLDLFKASKLEQVIDSEQYAKLQEMIDVSDFKSRLRIKKRDWFIKPEQSINSSRIMRLKKNLEYAQGVLNSRLN